MENSSCDYREELENEFAHAGGIQRLKKSLNLNCFLRLWDEWC